MAWRCRVREPCAVTLLYLDFDEKLPKHLEDRILWLCRLCHWPVIAIRLDRTRHGWHVVIGVRRRLAPAIIVAVQAALGSDWKREVFNIVRVQSLHAQSPYWRARWNVLFSQHAKATER